MDSLIKHIKRNDIWYYTVVFSLVATLIIQLASSGEYDSDGLLYLSAAKAFASNGFTAAMDMYGWPFYAVLIGELHTLLNIPVLLAAQIINTLFSVIGAVAFVKLIKSLNGDKITQFFALFTILMVHELIIQKTHVVRGLGYWPFALLAIAYLLQYTTSEKPRHALLGLSCIILAALFRIEAILLVFCPLFLTINTNQVRGSRVKYLLWPNSLLLLGVLVIAVISLGYFLQLDLSQAKFERIQYFHFNLTQGVQTVIANFTYRADLYAQFALQGVNGHPEWYAKGALAGGLVTYLLYLYIKVLGIPLGILLLWSLFNRVIKIDFPKWMLLISAIALNLALIFYFLFLNFFVSQRYLLFSALLLCCWIPFALQKFYLYWQQNRDKNKKSWLFLLLILIIFIQGIAKSVDFTQKKAYIMHAAQWLQQNSELTEMVLTNEKAILFYSERMGKVVKFNDNDAIALQDESVKDYDFIVAKISYRDKDFIDYLQQQLPQAKLQIITQNKRGDHIVIFKMP